MADNRMFIRCRICGETFYIGIYHTNSLSYSTYVQKEPKETIERLDKFFKEHSECIIDEYGTHLIKQNKIDFDNSFEISYEYDIRNKGDD